MYEHLGGTSTFIGDEVRRGQVIGRLGNTGLSTGPHLHFELLIGSDPIDPLAHIAEAPASALQPVREPTAAGYALALDQATPILSWPLPHQKGTITQQFGWAIYPFEPAKGQGYIHEGIDIAFATGTPVFAAADGVVSATGYEDRFGTFVVIGHAGEWTTRYNHLSVSEVVPAQQVKRGQQIGRLGNTGLSTGPHLEFVVLHGKNEYHDPLRFLTGVPPGSTTTSGGR